MLRWCQCIPDETLPLDDFIPPMRDETIDNVNVFRRVLKESFREDLATRTGRTADQELTRRIQAGIDGWSYLNKLQPEIMAFSRQWGASIRKQQEQQSKAEAESRLLKEQDEQKFAGYSNIIAGSEGSSAFYNVASDTSEYNEREWLEKKLDAVSWLPKIEDCAIRSLEVDPNKKFPMFPLASGPLLHPDTLVTSVDTKDNTNENEKLPLPLLTPQRETPIPGAEVPLKIFEPRYRQLYSDLQRSGRRQMVIPFPHPLQPDTFASVALVHHLTNLQEIADETNGKILYLADHVVVSPIEIEEILNPHVWSTRETYLQVRGSFLVEDQTDIASAEGGVYAPLTAVLHEWKAESSHPLANKSLNALKEHERVWDLVELWNSYFQRELLQLQLAVVTQVNAAAAMAPSVRNVGGATDSYSERMVLKAQEPHRRRLLQLMMETSLLVPTLLSMNNAEKADYLTKMVRDEQRYLKTNSY